MSFSEITRKIANSLSGLIFNEKKHKKAITQHRRLLIDPLEERQLLSVNVVMPQEKILTPFTEHSSPTITSQAHYINNNSGYGGGNFTESMWSNDYMSSNNQGDTVITWAQNDFVYRMDANGNYVLDAQGNRVLLTDSFGNPYNDYNIYAQYLTNQVERITLPAELYDNYLVGVDSSFKLIYSPYTVQQLSIKSVTTPNGGYMMGTGPNIALDFCLGGIDFGDGVQRFSEPIRFNENLSPWQNARNIEFALQNLGRFYGNDIYLSAKVTALSSTDFTITFETDTGGVAVPELQIRDTRILAGTYPGIVISTVSTPIVLSTQDSWGVDQGIIVDPTNHQRTAERIQQAFNSHSTMSLFPRVETFTRDLERNPLGEYVNLNNRPSYAMFYTPEVKVTYAGMTYDANGRQQPQFDVTFVNGGALSLHDFTIFNALDEFGTDWSNSTVISTVKKSSDIFRVNEPEANDPRSSVPLVTNQMNPSVAMDSDGDFVITWQSESYTTTTNTITDIYARRFSPQGILPDDKITFYDDGYNHERIVGGIANNPVQGVRPASDQFKVNSFSNNFATQPSIGMDPDGNFVISWSFSYQRTSDGNAVYARQYDRYGNALTDSIMLASDIQCPLIYSTVAISNDGYVAIAWVNSDDTNAQSMAWTNGIYMSIFAPGTLTPLPNWNAVQINAGTFNPSLSFDSHNQLLLTYSDAYPYANKGTHGAEMSDVRARVYSYNTGSGTFDLRTTDFRVHGQGIYVNGDADGSADEYWRGPQYNGVGAFDSDGDMIFVYQGYGPDSNMSQNGMVGYDLMIPGSFFTPYLNSNKNADLLMYFNPATDIFMHPTFVTSDVDVVIRHFLNQAIKSYQGTPNEITSEQLGRLNAIFESVAGMVRGGGNDVFTTRLNKGDFIFGDTPVIDSASSSDANVTSTRDGVNSHWYVMIPNYAMFPISGGSITFSVSTEFHAVGPAPSINLGFTMDNNVFLPYDYRDLIYSTLNSIGPGGFVANAFTNMLAPGVFAGGVIMPSAEVNYYAPGSFNAIYGDTIWALPEDSYGDISGYHIYEVIFVGGAHDLGVSLGINYNSSSLTRRDLDGEFRGSMSMYVEQYGYRGTEKGIPAISVLPNGSYVTTWFTDITTTNGMIIDRKINYRYFYEDSDNVGPKVTDVILPNGQYVANQDTLTYSIEQIVVTFDKELLANGVNGTHSVLNPSNWSIIKDGVRLNNAIKSISFGVNKAADIIRDNPGSIVADSVLSYGSNKWEVVIEFNQPLGSGSYELVATNMLCDTTGVRYERGQVVYGNGNALGSDGTNANGQNFTRYFNINAIDGTLSFYGGSTGYEEKLISDGGGNNYTRTDATLYDTPGTPTSVASDQYGNFVSVWTAEGVGILAKIYRQDFIDTPTGRESVITFSREIVVSSNPNASYASVAMDADGDFVVTWMQDDLDGSRNIYAKAFNYNGTVRMDADGNPTSEFRVNSHLGGKHSYPDIAMDLFGEFVITWESLNQVSKTSGYDIFVQRYDSSCSPIGGVDDIQALLFAGNPTGTFKLQYYDDITATLKETAAIAIDTSIQKTAANIQAALRAIGLDVDVEASASDTILVQFTRTMGAMKVSPLMVPAQSLNFTNPRPGQNISVFAMTSGASGEEQVNDVTEGDKRYPSIAMAPSGEFIVTWTSWGQGNDSPYQTNIYAKNFPSNEAVAARHNLMTLSDRINMMNTTASYNHEKLLMAADSPDNHLTPSNEYTGVVMVYAIDDEGYIMWSGSGSLLTTGMHVLTAAHVVFDDAGSPVPASNLIVRFETSAGFEYYPVTQNYVHPTYTGNYPVEVDLAVLTLSRAAPETAERYDIYRGSDELGTVQTLVGYGMSGTGWTGNVLPGGERRSGQNRFEAYGSIFDPTYNPNTLVFDFDSGSPQNDALGYYFGIHNLGLGSAYESFIAPGDSGGPSFINGKIAGVHSYGGPMYPNSPVDAVPGTNFSFGEFGIDVRVSAYADWIDSILVIGGGAGEYLVNQTEAGDQIWSDVAISASGEVIFTWTSFNQDHAGDGPGGSSTGLAGVYARRFDMQGNPIGDIIVTGNGSILALGNEFLVNDYITGDQWHSSVSMANNGDFMIVWESYQDKHQITVQLPDTGLGIGGTITTTMTDFGIYAKRYANLATLLRSQDNSGSAQYGLPDNTRFVPGYGYVGIHGEIGSEFRVNTTLTGGDQTGATVTLNGNGDAIVVFQSNEGLASSETKDYYRAIPLQVDRSAPIVTETVLVVNALVPDDEDDENDYKKNPDGSLMTDDGQLMPVRDGSIIAGFPTEMIVTFSEEMFAAFLYDPTSVINLSNWQLLRNGVTISGAVAEVYFGMDMARVMGLTQTSSGKWEAVIRFDSNLALPGNQPLGSGRYSLVLRDTVTDLAGNRLDGNYSGTSGVNFTRNFRVVVPAQLNEPGDDGRPDDTDHKYGPSDLDRETFINKELGNDKPVIASADDGSYVVVAVHYGIPGTINEPWLPGMVWEYDPDTGLPQIGNIVMQRYDKYGEKVGMQQIVNNYMDGHQTDPDVAMNSVTGDIAVVWSGAGSRGDHGVYLRLYDAYGKATGDQIWVNGVSNANCSTPKVACDDRGNIVVTWIEYYSELRANIVMTRVYDSLGNLRSISKDGAAPLATMALVAENARNVNAYDIAFSPNGHLVVTWQIHDATTNSQNIFAKVLQLTNDGKLNTTVQPLRVNQYTNQIQARPSVAASNTGFVITWASERQAALSDRPELQSLTFDVYARRFNMSGVAQPILGTTGDRLINSQKAYAERTNQRDYPDVSMASDGSFVITWSSYDQEPNNYDDVWRVPAHDYATFARAFGSNGNDLDADFVPYSSSQEFRLNYTTLGDQIYSVATIWSTGMAFAWVGPSTTTLIFEYDDDGYPTDWATLPVKEVYARNYSVGGRTAGQEQGLSDRTIGSIYSLTQPIGGGGYSGQGVNTYKYENLDTLFLNATGADAFEIFVTASGTFQVTVNGVTQAVNAGVTNIHINGGGQDSVVVTTANGVNSAKYNSEEKHFTLSTGNKNLSISVTQVNTIELNVGGSNNTIQVMASGNDVLTLGVGDIHLTGGNNQFTASGFDIVSALASGSSAKAILFDSDGDDVLTMSPGQAVMKGQEYEHSVSGFGNITAYSSRGNNMATLNGSTGDDAVFATAGMISMSGTGYKNTVFGFEKVNVIGNGGNDSASIVGSYANDRFNATDTYAEAVFGLGGSVNLYGFNRFTIHGNGGNDVVSLNGVNLGSNTDTGTTKVYSNATQTYTVIGVNDVRGIQQPAPAAAPASAYFAAEDDFFQLLAEGHNNGSSHQDFDSLDDELDIDLLLETGLL